MPTPKLDPYLTFDGTTADAFKFYETVLGAKIEYSMTFGESPMGANMPPEHRGRTMHAKLTIDGQVLMGSDAPPGYSHEGMKGFALSLNYPTAAAAKAKFAELAEGGTITMPIDKTFWAAAFGMLIDRFGVPWMLGCEKES